MEIFSYGSCNFPEIKSDKKLVLIRQKLYNVKYYRISNNNTLFIYHHAIMKAKSLQ